MFFIIKNANNKIYIILLLYLIIKFNNYEIYNPTNIPELLYYNNQTINLLIPPKKCPATLIFFSDSQRFKFSKKVKRIIFKNKNSFITFYNSDEKYTQYINLLESNGLIKSIFNYGENNLFIYPMNINISNKFSFNNNNSLNKYQKVYRHLDSAYIFQKNSLYKCYSSIKRLFDKDFKYMPETYYYPEEEKVIQNKFKNYHLNISDLWLVKPSNSGSGKKITFLKLLKNINLKEYVITKYITNINLIQGKKYDLRLYVLIPCLKPLRIYIYSEGLVRIATETYSLNESYINNIFVHLTNVDINKISKNFVIANTSNDINANTWNLLMYKKFLRKHHIEWRDIKEQIKDIIIKSIISVYQNLTEENERQNLNENSFYNILGFDILINNKFQPILLEINKNPSMKFLNNLDREIKNNLIIDTLNLVGIIPFSRKSKEPIFNKLKFKNNVDENINNAFCELKRPRGGYEFIFPKKNNINTYKKFFIYNTEENKIFWYKIMRYNYSELSEP